jgi:hypothetical protein
VVSPLTCSSLRYVLLEFSSVSDKADKARKIVIPSGMRIQISHSVCISPPTLYTHSLTTGQIGKILGERWKNMTDKDKQQYDAKATKDKERYEAEKRAYNVHPLP